MNIKDMLNELNKIKYNTQNNLYIIRGIIKDLEKQQKQKKVE